MISHTENPFVSVSIDGADADTHEWMRGVKGAFERSLSALRNLVDAGLKPQVIMTIVRRNSGQISRMIEMAETLGAASIKFNILQPMARGVALQDAGETMSVQEILRLRQWVDNELTNHTKIKLYFDVPLAFRPLSRIDKGDSGTCGIQGILGVIPSGHYALCGVGEHIPELVFGKVGYDALLKVWGSNPVLNEIRSDLPGKLEGVCSRCLMAGSCLGSCVAQNYYRTGSLWAPFWLCEQAETQGIFPATRLKAGLTRHNAVELNPD
jgi:SynChlorMet cassette radical SAM/SPASM protein ScmF